MKLKCEKLKFIVHYFERIFSDNRKLGEEFVTFARHVLKDAPDWSKSKAKLTTAKVYSEGTIEDNGVGMLQMDFANCFIGGGVLNEGSVQEEIRFLINPELMVSRLLCECMEDNEAIVITGAEQFSRYSGYGSSLTWSGDFRDQTPKDSLNRVDVRVVAADALHFDSHKIQFRKQMIDRELCKALTAFHPSGSDQKPSAVATGNWGCGVFNGDANLKFLIQLMAASAAKRDICYFTFGEGKLDEELANMFNFLISKNINVGQIYKLLISYYSNVVMVSPRRLEMTLYDFIYQQHE